MKSMRLIAPVLVVVCLLVAALAWARGDYPRRGNAEEQSQRCQIRKYRRT